MNELLKAIDLIDDRLDKAMKAFHDCTLWDEMETYWDEKKTYQEAINDAFAEARRLAAELEK
jgi:hypothetical protein